MDEFERGKFGFIFFFMIVIGLAFGGYYYVKMDKTGDVKTNGEENIKLISDALKIEKDKSFIYTDIESMLAADIIYTTATVNINSDDARRVNSLLTKELEEIKKDVIYLSDIELPDDVEIVHLHDDIYKARVRDYEFYTYEKYATLVLYDYHHVCTDDYGAKDMRAYTFDVETGKLLSSDEVLAITNYSFEDVKDKIQSYLTKELSNLVASDSSMVNFIQISNSLNNLSIDKSLIYYIDKKGKLNASFVVITEKNDYNDNIIFD